MKILYGTLLLLLVLVLTWTACQNQTENLLSEEQSLPWHAKATIYELNIRQFTPEGTFEAVLPHLPRIKEMGVDIVWLMPIYPIGQKERKGSLGSYYAISDYQALNPEFGTEEDFRSLVSAIHEQGMKVILDWVANHTAWDHVWVAQHPDWYTRDSLGNSPIVPIDNEGNSTDWTDTADLDYDNEEMRKAMQEAMLYWVKEFDVDGFRCDVAGFVPNDFWEATREQLNPVKEVFMLAEWEDAALHERAFEMTYAWDFHHQLNAIAQQKKKLQPTVAEYLKKEKTTFPPSAYRMNFVTNHDENSWNGTVEERMGSSAENMTVLAYTLFGMPLVYSGQEAPLQKRLAFFEKDTIDWNGYQNQAFLSRLLHLNRDNEALFNGKYGGEALLLPSPNEEVLVFIRAKNNNKVWVMINQTEEDMEWEIANPSPEAPWREYRGEQVIGEQGEAVLGALIPAKGHQIWIQNLP